MADTPVAAAVNAVKAQAPEAAPEMTQETPAQPSGATDPQQEVWARKERAIRKQQQELQAERKRWESEQASLKQKYESDYIPKEALKSDPINTLLDMGLSYEQLTELVLTGHNSQDPAVRALRNEIKALKDGQLEAQKKQEEAVKQQYDQAITQIKGEIKQLTDNNPSFETIKQTGMHDAVLELITQTFEAEGYLMDVEEAAKQVEDYLLDEAVKLATLGKVQSRLKPQTPPEAPSPQKPQEPGLKTLTHKATTAQATKLTEKERRERAIAAFYGNKG